MLGAAKPLRVGHGEAPRRRFRTPHDSLRNGRSSPGDQVWQDLDDGALVDLAAVVSGGVCATCDPRYPAFIDHIVIQAANYHCAIPRNGLSTIARS
jgi:hypothetical protein